MAVIDVHPGMFLLCTINTLFVCVCCVVCRRWSHTHTVGSVAEDASVGIPIFKVAAVDPDVVSSRRVRYSMEPQHVGVLFTILFTIDAVSDVITLLQSLDRERQASYNLTVSASDQGQVLSN